MILTGEATSAQIAGFVVALRAKGENAEELSGLLDAVLAQAASRAARPTTSGRGRSTSSAPGATERTRSTCRPWRPSSSPAPGCRCASTAPGRRRRSAAPPTCSKQLGVAIELTPEGVARCVAEAGIGFCFAPAFHPAFRRLRSRRREIGIPTAFNLLGPMANPGRVRRQLIGVAEPRFAEAMVDALRQHGLDLGLGRARRRARRAHDHGHVEGDRAARRHDRGVPRSTPPTSDSRRRRPTICAAAGRRRTPRWSAGCWPATPGRTATSCC